MENQNLFPRFIGSQSNKNTPHTPNKENQPTNTQHAFPFQEIESLSGKVKNTSSIITPFRSSLHERDIRHSRVATSTLEYAKEFYTQGDIYLAIEQLEDVLKLKDDQVSDEIKTKALIMLGDCYMDGGDAVAVNLSKAFECYTQALHLDPTSSTAARKLAYCYKNGNGVGLNEGTAQAYRELSDNLASGNVEDGWMKFIEQSTKVTNAQEETRFDIVTATPKQLLNEAKRYQYGLGVTRNIETAQQYIALAREKALQVLEKVIIDEPAIFNEQIYPTNLGSSVDIYEITDFFYDLKDNIESKIFNLSLPKEERNIARRRLEQVEQMVNYARVLEADRWKPDFVNQMIFYRMQLRANDITGALPKELDFEYVSWFSFEKDVPYGVMQDENGRLFGGLRGVNSVTNKLAIFMETYGADYRFISFWGNRQAFSSGCSESEAIQRQVITYRSVPLEEFYIDDGIEELEQSYRSSLANYTRAVNDQEKESEVVQRQVITHQSIPIEEFCIDDGIEELEQSYRKSLTNYTRTESGQEKEPVEEHDKLDAALEKKYDVTIKIWLAFHMELFDHVKLPGTNPVAKTIKIYRTEDPDVIKGFDHDLRTNQFRGTRPPLASGSIGAPVAPLCFDKNLED